MNYLITGATGDLGFKTLTYLQNKVESMHLFALARSEKKAAQLKENGINVRLGDYGDLKTLKQAFKGIDTLFFLYQVILIIAKLNIKMLLMLQKQQAFLVLSIPVLPT